MQSTEYDKFLYSIYFHNKVYENADIANSQVGFNVRY